MSVHDMQLRNSSTSLGCSRVGTTGRVGPIGASFPKIKIKYTYFFPPERKSQIHFFLRKVRTPARVNTTEHNTLTPDGLRSLQWDSCFRGNFWHFFLWRENEFCHWIRILTWLYLSKVWESDCWASLFILTLCVFLIICKILPDFLTGVFFESKHKYTCFPFLLISSGWKVWGIFWSCQSLIQSAFFRKNWPWNVTIVLNKYLGFWICVAAQKVKRWPEHFAVLQVGSLPSLKSLKTWNKFSRCTDIIKINSQASILEVQRPSWASHPSPLDLPLTFFISRSEKDWNISLFSVCFFKWRGGGKSLDKTKRISPSFRDGGALVSTLFIFQCETLRWWLVIPKGSSEHLTPTKTTAAAQNRFVFVSVVLH